MRGAPLSPDGRSPRFRSHRSPIQDHLLHGVRRRRIPPIYLTYSSARDDLVRVLGIDGISRSEVSRICKVLDGEVRTFLPRPIESECPYAWLDATFIRFASALVRGRQRARRPILGRLGSALPVFDTRSFRAIGIPNAAMRA